MASNAGHEADEVRLGEQRPNALAPRAVARDLAGCRLLLGGVGRHEDFVTAGLTVLLQQLLLIVILATPSPPFGQSRNCSRS